jgi:hypothetical protein
MERMGERIGAAAYALRRCGMGGASRWCVSVACVIVAATGAWADHARECGTMLGPEDLERILAQEVAGAYLLRDKAGGEQLEYLLSVPLAIHVVRQSDGTGGLPDSSVANSIAVANAKFAGAGFQLFQQGATRFIDSDALYFNVDTQAEIDQLKQTDVIQNALNCYFTQNLADAQGSLCGQASFTTTQVQGVVVRNSCTTNGGNLSTFAHELGHFFDLFHTHETTFGVECPNGSNCATAGDRICDTPADPTLSSANMDTLCNYTGNATACNGQIHAPDPSNLMSYAEPKNCRANFTFQQNNKMLATLVNLRSALIQAPGLNVTWVDFGYTGSSNGSYAAPWKTMAEAVNAAPNGGRIVIKAGSTPATLTTNKPLILESFRGTAVIGDLP